MNTAPDWNRFRHMVDDCPKLDEAMGHPCMATPCPTCPFRKDRSVWMEAWQHLLNLFRVREGRVQHCHNDTHRVCFGSAIIVAGIDHPAIFNEEEFTTVASRMVARDNEEAKDRYGPPPRKEDHGSPS